MDKEIIKIAPTSEWLIDEPSLNLGGYIFLFFLTLSVYSIATKKIKKWGWLVILLTIFMAIPGIQGILNTRISFW